MIQLFFPLLSLISPFFFPPPGNLQLYATTSISEEKIPHHIQEILEEGRFTYLGEGAQAIAFLSSNEKYVLKVFKKRRDHHFKWRRLLHPPNSQALKADWTSKFEAMRDCYTLAYRLMPEETGLLFVHFEKSPSPCPVTLKDKRGFVHRLDLSAYPFLVQKKAELTLSYFQRLIAENRLEDAQKALLTMKAFFKKRAAKQLTDPRQTLSANYGFVEDQFIQLDVGKIEEKSDAEEQLPAIFSKIDQWAAKHFAQY